MSNGLEMLKFLNRKMVLDITVDDINPKMNGVRIIIDFEDGSELEISHPDTGSDHDVPSLDFKFTLAGTAG
jgi:hypothetical protein